MKIIKRRERDPEKMRRKILDAAKTLFAKESFESVSIRRIASVIGYSPAAIYRYFGSKREIFSILREEGFERHMADQKQWGVNIVDPLERLRTGFKEYLRFAMAEPEYFHLMFCTKDGEVDLEGDFATNSLKSFDLFRQTIDECVESGYFGETEAETTAFAIWSSAHGLAHLVNTGRVDVMSSRVNMDNLLNSIAMFQLRPG